jgi:RNA polymerase sigma-32 factor
MNDSAQKIMDSKAIAIADPLHRYMQEVQTYPMLSLDEEKELARRFHEDGDVEAAKKLVASHLRLVVKIAMEYRNAYYNALDLIQEGNVGLMQAVRHFEADKGSRLAHYATWWIRSYILKYILDNFRLIRIGTTKAQKKLFFNLMQEKERIEAMGFTATPVELSKRLGVSEDLVLEMQGRLTTPEYALEAPINGQKGEGTAILQDFLPLDEAPIDERLANEQSHDMLKDKFAEFSQGLNDRERRILQDRLLAELPITLQDIADEYGISKERVRQIEARIVQKLKTFFKGSGVEVEALRL